LFGGARVERGIVAGLGEQERARAGFQMDGDVGVLGEELRQPRQQPAGGERRHGCQPDRTARPLARHGIERVALQSVQPSGDAPRVGNPFLGQADPVPRAPEQGDIQERLQAGDASRHRPLRQRQLARGPRVALVAGRHLEALQRLEAGKFSGHDMRHPNVWTACRPEPAPYLARACLDIPRNHILLRTFRLPRPVRVPRMRFSPSVGRSMSRPVFSHEDPFGLTTQLSAEEQMIRDAAADYATTRLAPAVTDAFRNEHTDAGIFREMGALGLLGATLPEQYGGTGLNYVSYGLI